MTYSSVLLEKLSVKILPRDDSQKEENSFITPEREKKVLSTTVEVDALYDREDKPEFTSIKTELERLIKDELKKLNKTESERKNPFIRLWLNFYASHRKNIVTTSQTKLNLDNERLLKDYLQSIENKQKSLAIFIGSNGLEKLQNKIDIHEFILNEDKFNNKDINIIFVFLKSASLEAEKLESILKAKKNGLWIIDFRPGKDPDPIKKLISHFTETLLEKLSPTSEPQLINSSDNVFNVIDESDINLWISEKDNEEQSPLQLGKSYTLNFQVILEKSYRELLFSGNGIDTEWIVSSSTIKLDAETSVDTDINSTKINSDMIVWSAKFNLHIPIFNNSEVRQLKITPQAVNDACLVVLIYARGELYRQFNVQVEVIDTN